jgi:hypothetical protein
MRHCLNCKNYIDERIVFESSEAISIVPTFDQLGLKGALLRGIYAYSKPALTHCNQTKKRLNSVSKQTSSVLLPSSSAPFCQ